MDVGSRSGKIRLFLQQNPLGCCFLPGITPTRLLYILYIAMPKMAQCSVLFTRTCFYTQFRRPLFSYYYTYLHMHNILKSGYEHNRSRSTRTLYAIRYRAGLQKLKLKFAPLLKFLFTSLSWSVKPQNQNHSCH